MTAIQTLKNNEQKMTSTAELKPDTKSTTIFYPIQNPSLEELQKMVGGNIGLIYFGEPVVNEFQINFSNGTKKRYNLSRGTKKMYINEEGIPMHLPFNPQATEMAGQPIVGNAVVMDPWMFPFALDSEDEEDSLTCSGCCVEIVRESRAHDNIHISDDGEKIWCEDCICGCEKCAEAHPHIFSSNSISTNCGCEKCAEAYPEDNSPHSYCEICDKERLGLYCVLCGECECE